MVGVVGVGRAATWGTGGAKPATSAGGFSVPAGAAPAAAAAPAPAAPVAVDTLLALQEMPSEGVRDRAARRHGEAMLRLLAALQRARLGEPDRMAAVLAELGGSVDGGPEATDPVLRQLVSAIGLRAKIELARAP